MTTISSSQHPTDIKKEGNIQQNEEIDVIEIIKRVQILQVVNGLKQVQISEFQFIQLIRKAKKCLQVQPSLLRLSCPIRVATGTIGYFKDLAELFIRCGHPNNVNYLFLGDYAGRGQTSIQCLVALLAYKINNPYNFFMLRGCYQSTEMTKSHNLFLQITKRFSSHLFKELSQVFSYLPFAATIQDKVFCVHGGLSPQLVHLQQINKIIRPIETPNKELICDLVWSDPNEHKKGWSENQRGISYSYGEDVVGQFLDKNNLKIMCRGHEIVEQGFEILLKKRLISICSLANYCGFYRNKAGILNIDNEMNVYNEVIKEKQSFKTKINEK